MKATLEANEAVVKLYDLRGDQVPLSVYRNHMAASMKKNGSGNICPEAILGCEPGKVIDFTPYIELGFHHPKAVDYYDPANEQFKAIMDGIIVSERFDDPVLLYVIDKSDDEKLILCLNGATRLSSAMLHRSDNPDSFKRVEFVYFRGTPDEARAAMVARNIGDRTRPLTAFELSASIKHFIASGWTEDEIAKRLIMNAQKVKDLMNMDESLIPDLRRAVEAGKISTQTAIESAKLPQDKQEAIAGKVDGGEKVTVRTARKENDNAGKNINFDKWFKRREDDMTDLEKALKAKKKFSKVETEFRAFQDALVYLQTEVNKALGIAEAE